MKKRMTSQREIVIPLNDRAFFFSLIISVSYEKKKKLTDRQTDKQKLAGQPRGKLA